mgnify:CR=1 FL=1
MTVVSTEIIKNAMLSNQKRFMTRDTRPVSEDK